LNPKPNDMKKLKFTVPVAQSFTTSGKLESIQLGEYYLEVEYTDHDDFDYSIIEWNGHDIFDLVVNTTEGDAILSKLVDAVRNHAASLMEEKTNHDYTND